MGWSEPNGNWYKLDADSIVIHIVALANENMSAKGSSQEKDLPASQLVCFETCLDDIGFRSSDFPGSLSHQASCCEASMKITRQPSSCLLPSGASCLVSACDWQQLERMTGRYFTSVWCLDCHPFLPTLAIVILGISRNPTAANANARPLWSYSGMQYTLYEKWKVDQGHCIREYNDSEAFSSFLMSDLS